MTPDIVGGAAPSPADLDAADRVEKMRETELARIQALAARWRDGLAGLIALLAAAVIIKGTDSVADLPTWARWSIGTGILASLVASITGGIFAMLAAYGWSSGPQPVGSLTDLDERLRKWDREVCDAAAARLRTAVVLTVISLGFATVVIGLTFFAPTRAKGGVAPECLLLGSTGSGEVAAGGEKEH
ncbi:hypothetical protein Ga0074812_10525 [Parafrankia irregularis]|uniref:Uncharacterized protein n=1 Tax=Parafrankia irregularis TaxID=795642 RepID=A0A0S4QIK9_9ACTN|nr:MULTISPECIES: hypothetical protein [Parafrankia]MBE3205724.1 hypothetical protein [Parafrankia sp. CH37]CUU55376.1 hypothetical protein Ga0074812_10525 [Parafrankia irregularis]